VNVICIDAPGDGQWIMERVTGVFTPELDHSFAVHVDNDDGQILGGFALCQYLGASITIHVAGTMGKRWLTRELLWLVFDYAFNQLKCRKVIAPVRSDNYLGLSMDFRAGWNLEAVIHNAYDDGVHMMVLTTTKDKCPWLNYKPRKWRSGAVEVGHGR
jgi:hypothetical protein